MAEGPGASGPRCPRCRSRLDDRGQGPYRRAAAGVDEPVPLAAATHASGAQVLGCPSCGGHFVEYADMLRLERSGRGAARDAVARRAFAEARGPVTCAKCGGETARREWSIGTLTYVDVCVDFDCRGVWLDAGELEAIAGEPH